MSELPPPAPGRVRVSAEDPAPPSPGASSAQPQDFYVDQLRRAQARASLAVAGAFLAVLTVLAIGVSTWPLLEAVTLARLPLSWWLIGFCLYPLVLGAAVLHRFWAARLERRYRQVSSA